MSTCLLIRHGQSRANVDGILAGHVQSQLTDDGLSQAARLAEALAEVPISRIVTSPLDRCTATAREIGARQVPTPPIEIEEQVVEVRYGGWTGRNLKDLAKDDLWKAVQAAPSTVTFPEDPSGGYAHESMSAMAERAWGAWQRWDQVVAETDGKSAVWALVSHGDVIKALLAQAMGLSLDSFQSIIIDPASVSIIEAGHGRTGVRGMNLRDDLYRRLAAQPGDEEQDSAPIGVVGGGNA